MIFIITGIITAIVWNFYLLSIVFNKDKLIKKLIENKHAFVGYHKINMGRLKRLKNYTDDDKRRYRNEVDSLKEEKHRLSNQAMRYKAKMERLQKCQKE